MRFALLSVVPRVSAAALDRIARAYVIRGADVAAAWSAVFPHVIAPEVRVCEAVSDLTDDDVPMLAVPSLDAPGDLAYHTIRDGHPYGLILADEFQTLPSVEAAFAHEIGECMVDPSCDRYDAAGIAIEVYDPMQGQPQPVDLGDGAPVAFEAHVLPAWNGYGTGATTSTGLALAPHALAPGGYFQREDGSQVMGERHVSPPHKWHHHSRPSKRRRARGRA